MFVAGPKFKNPPASKLASDFRPFDPGIKLCDYLQTYEVTTMKYQIKDGTVTLGGETILSHIDFEIQGNQKIAVVGRNGAGKTTLLRLIAGELSLDRDDRRQGPGITASRQLTVEMLGQQALAGEERTVEELVMLNCPAKGSFDRERFEYEREYDTLFTGLGFQKEDKKRSVAAFSGGQKTKIALIQLLLKKPDLLLLDEPTNHLDMETASWLEGYLRQYPGAVVMVSHDRFFMDRTADIVYELEQGKLTRYPGNYTNYREQKRKNYEIQMKSYLRQQEEIERQEELIKRFKNKPSKAAFARSRKKILERMLPVEKPREDMAHIFTGTITPLIPGSKWVFEAEHLKIGYDKHSLLELSLRIRKGQKIGILGVNGSGKTTFLKTVAGFLPAVAGECALGNNITIGYFDQYSAAIQSEKTVVEHFSDLFPSLIGLLGGFGAGVAYTMVRRLGQIGENKAYIVFFFSAFSCVVTLPYLLFCYEPMTWKQLLCLVMAGLSAAGGQFGVTSAYCYAPAKEISVYDYTQIIFAAGLGFLLFAQIPDWLSILGYCIIIAMAVVMFFYNKESDK